MVNKLGQVPLSVDPELRRFLTQTLDTLNNILGIKGTSLKDTILSTVDKQSSLLSNEIILLQEVVNEKTVHLDSTISVIDSKVDESIVLLQSNLNSSEEGILTRLDNIDTINDNIITSLVNINSAIDTRVVEVDLVPLLDTASNQDIINKINEILLSLKVN